MPDLDPNATAPQDEQKINVLDWINKFSAAERVMKDEFLNKYKLAKRRLRAETDVKNRNSKKMTHENVNLVYSIGQSFNSSVYFKSPNCNLTAREEINHKNIENTEIKVNDWLKDKKVKQTIKRVIWDAYLGGFGARFIDYEYDDVEDPNNILEPAQLDEMGQEIAPPVFGRIVLKNDITIQRIRPDLIRFPKGFDFDNYEKAPWIGFDVIMPLEEIKANQNWPQEVTALFKGQKYSKLSDSEDKKSQGSEGDDLYEKLSFVFVNPLSKLENWQLIVFCHAYPEKELQAVDFDKGTVGCPLKFMYFNPLDDDSSYPNGDPWNFESQLAAIDMWWKKMVLHTKKSNPKTVYNIEGITPQEIQKVKTDGDLEFIGIKNKDRIPIQQLFYEFQRAPVHPDVSRLYEVARQLTSEISPRSGLARGSEDEKVDTATEAKIINTGEVIDIEARIDVVRDFIIDIVLDVAGILEKSLMKPVPVAKPLFDEKGNETGESQVVPIGRDGFTSKINVDVDVESMQAQNKDVLFRQLTDLFQVVVNFEPILNKSGETVDGRWWLERILETRNVRNIEKGIKPLPPQPLMVGPDGKPIPGAIPSAGAPSPISSDQNMMVQEDAMAGRV